MDHSTQKHFRLDQRSSKKCRVNGVTSFASRVKKEMAPRARQSMPQVLSSLFVLIVIFTSHGECQHSDANKVILLDTTNQNSLDWTRYPYGPQSRTPGWVEESFTDFQKGINWRSYVVCDVAYNNVNNWLWTPFIERKDANRIYIEVKFSMRDCNLFPGMALSCKETFSLLYYEFDASASKEPPPWEPESYKLIDRIAADEGRFTSNAEVIINTEVRSIPVTKKGVYFAFRDQGACLSLISIKIYSVVCPSIVNNFAIFPETQTGAELTAIVPAEGACVPNAIMVEPPRLLCKGDGNWTLPTGGCKCMAGYEPVGQSCKVCPQGTFKPTAGDDLCIPCPAHSTAPYRGSTECRCDHGFYRAVKDPKWAPCTQPPSAPNNLTASIIDSNTVVLSWSPPSFLGNRNDTIYKIECENCPKVPTFIPGQELNDTRVAITGLNIATNYKFKVYAENGASGRQPSQFSDISVRMEGEISSYIPLTTDDESRSKVTESAVTASPSISSSTLVTSGVTILNVKIVRSSPSEMYVTWDPLEDTFTNGEKAVYEVRYYKKGGDANNPPAPLTTSNSEILIPNLRERAEYVVQVRGRTASRGWTNYSKPVYRSTGQPNAPSGIVGKRDTVKEVSLIAGITSATIALVAVIILLVVVYLKRNTDDCSKKQPSDCDTLEYTRPGEVVSSLEHPPLVPTARFNSQYNSPYTMGKGTQIFTHYSASPSYVEAHHYEDPNQILPLATLKQTTCISYGANTLSGNNHTSIPSYTTSNSYSTLNDTNSGNSNTGPATFHHTLIGLNNSHASHPHHQQQTQQNIFPCDFTSIRDISNSLNTNRTTLSRRTDL